MNATNLTSVSVTKAHYHKVCQGIQDEETVDIIGEIYRAITAHIYPQLPAFLALVATINALKRKEFGLFQDNHLVWLPTVIVGKDCSQYQTPAMQWIHSAMMPIHFSGQTKMYLQMVLQQKGISISFFCNGNYIVGNTENIRAFNGSYEYTRREKIYSAMQCSTNHPMLVTEIDAIPVRSIDISLCGAENELLQEIEKMLFNLRSMPGLSFQWIEHEIEKSLDWLK